MEGHVLVVGLTPDTEELVVDGAVVTHFDRFGVPIRVEPGEWRATVRGERPFFRRHLAASVADVIVSEAAASRETLREVRDAADDVLRMYGRDRGGVRPWVVFLLVVLSALIVPACEAGLLDTSDTHTEIGVHP